MNMKNGFRILATLVVAIAGTASRSYAGPITVPVGLAPGSQYRLVFVTSALYTSASTNIADYNTDVNNAANAVGSLAALGTTWLDIGSTATVDAINNIGQDAGVPIYNLGGLLVANDGTNSAAGDLFFNGYLLADQGVNYDQNGVVAGTFDANYYAYTGSFSNGTGIAEHQLGSGFGTEIGESQSGTSSQVWIQLCNTCGNDTAALYGISGVLTVASSSGVPEPATMGLTFLALPILLFAMRRKHQSRRATGTIG